MRAIVAGLALGLFLVVVGCTPTQQNFINKGNRPPVPPPKAPEPAALVRYLNDNAKLISGLQSQVDMDCKQDRQSVSLSGTVNASWPRDFRLRGRAFGQPAVDVGSNNNEFWFWVNDKNMPYVYHCSYADLARGPVDLPFPFQPDMIMAALGMSQSDPNKQYQLRESPQYLELIENTVSPQGQPTYKVTVFNRLEVSPPQPQVVGHKLIDQKGNVICQAVVKKVAVSPNRAAVPQEVYLSWPEQKMSLNLILSRPQVVSYNPQDVSRLFQRTNLNMPTFDLARRQPDSPGLQRAGLR
jgi:hypothetical protein